jgi:Glutaredoxin-like domain (DUF836)
MTVYVAQGCHLCDAALEVIERVRGEVPFVLQVVDITDDTQLEARYRAEIPVVEIDGDRAFRYFVTADAIREAVS